VFLSNARVQCTAVQQALLTFRRQFVQVAILLDVTVEDKLIGPGGVVERNLISGIQTVVCSAWTLHGVPGRDHDFAFCTLTDDRKTGFPDNKGAVIPPQDGGTERGLSEPYVVAEIGYRAKTAEVKANYISRQTTFQGFSRGFVRRDPKTLAAAL
jgi:hypothetical protein